MKYLFALLICIQAHADDSVDIYNTQTDQRIDQLNQRLNNMQQEMELDRVYDSMDKELEIRQAPILNQMDTPPPLY